jgi:hypothetical protein
MAGKLEAFMAEIHDNTIKSYFVDLENRRIIFNTEFCGKNIFEKTTIAFNNVMGHLFTNESKNSIIFDIVQYSVNDYLNKYDDILEDKDDYDFQFRYNTDEELVIKLNENNQKYFEILSSYGLYGWIMAEEMKIETNKK